ncbi:AbgT family transporter [Streptomyces sp. NPDC056652]|uniref:AbgT family transporter n=1 Tax=Streptomyces sp. NPDC056652 TaxID=3345893 RepID=UPI00368EC508
MTLTRAQRRGLLWTGLVLAGHAAVVLVLWLPAGAPLRGAGGAFVPSPVLSGIVPVLFGAFLLAGLTYGITVKALTGTEDVVTAMSDSVRNMAGYVVLMFVAAQVIAVFNWSNVGVLLAVKAVGYEPEARLGTLISRLAVFVVPFLAVWPAILGIFHGFGLPLGPGAEIGLDAPDANGG